MTQYALIRKDTGSRIVHQASWAECDAAREVADLFGESGWALNLGDDGEMVFLQTDWSARSRPWISGELWPMHSDAAGVSPSQIPEAIAEAKKHGVSISFTKDGRARFEDRAHRRAYCEVRGLVDLSGGYSDPRHFGRIANEDG